MAVSLATMGCSRPNPAFGDTESVGVETDGDGPTVTASEAGGDPSGGPAGATSPDSETSNPTADDGSTTTGSPSETDAPTDHAVFVYQGPVTHGGIATLSPDSGLDPARVSCVAAGVSTFPDLCSSAERTASLVRSSGRMIDDLVARGVPTTRPIRSPAGDLVAVDLDTWIESGPEQPLIETPSIFVGNAVPFWTGGREPSDPNCMEWTAGMVAPSREFGTIGSQHVTDGSWLPADLQACNSTAAILCLCW